MQKEFIIRQSPFVFLKLVVIIEFFFAFLPLLLAFLFGAEDAYTGTGFARTIPYTLFITILSTSAQILIITIAFVTWYMPFYQIDKWQILYRRGSLFPDQKIANTQLITAVDVKQGWLARRLGYGALVLTLSDSKENGRIRGISDPAGFGELVMSLFDPLAAPQMLPEPKPVKALLGDRENQHVEFKSSLMWDYRRQMVNKDLYEPVMKNVAAFMNSTGGTVLIGVDDDGNVLGLDADYHSMPKPNPDGYENVFNMAFNKMIGVEFRQNVEITFPEINKKTICSLRIQPSSQPAFLRFKGVETFYIRAGNASQPLTVSQATRYIDEHFDE